jgi:Holliday junction resolvase
MVGARQGSQEALEGRAVTAYARGTAFERRTRERLEAVGWTVIRSAGSKTKVDLVAVSLGWVLFIQCKYNGILAKAEWDELVELSEKGGDSCSAVLATTIKRELVFYELTGKKIPYARSEKQMLMRIFPLEYLSGSKEEE